MVLGEGGQRFLELTTIEFPPATPESMALMHESRYRVEKAWREFMTTTRSSSDRSGPSHLSRTATTSSTVDTAMKVVELFRFVLPANLMGLPAACVRDGRRERAADGRPDHGDTLPRRPLPRRGRGRRETQSGVLTPIDPRA